MNRFEFYKGLYDDEYNRRQELTQNVSIPLGVLTVLGGILAYYVQSFSIADLDTTANTVLAVLTAIPLALASFFFGRGVWFLSCVFRYRPEDGGGYHALPYGAELLKYDEDLVTHHRENHSSESEAQKEFEEFLVKRLAAHAERNGRINDTRADDMDRAKRYMLLSLVLAILCSIPVGIKKFMEPVHVTKVEIMGLPRR